MRTRSAILYAVLRILAFLVPFGILMLFPIFQSLPWLAALFASLIGLSLSLLFLRRPLAEATTTRPRATTDEDFEDAAAEGAASDPDQPTNAQNRNAP